MEIPVLVDTADRIDDLGGIHEVLVRNVPRCSSSSLASVRTSYVMLLEDDCDRHALHILGDHDEDRIVIDINEDDMNYLLRDFGPNAKKLAQRYGNAAVLGVILDDQVRNIYAWQKAQETGSGPVLW